MMFFPSNHERGERHSLSALQESRAQRLRIHCYWFRHLFHAQTICCSLTFDMWSHACGKGPYSLSHKRREVTSSFPHRNAPTEEDKTRHQFNRNVLVLCHDIISCHLSPLVICRPPRRATTASGDNSRGYGLTGGSPCSAASRERCARPGQVAAVLLCESRSGERSCFSSADEVLPGPRCSEMESMPFPVPLDAE